ncbi:MAG: hypothetical protein KGZ71_02220 [Desulfobulbaceae bacterium]|nr:hypothetical protein [Desulfobulbaceae bacterium]
MKKLLLLASILLVACCAVAYSLFESNPKGYTSSNGLNYMEGQAYNLRIIAGGYAFYCEGSGDCYAIDGPNLSIWEIGVGFGGDDIYIWRN